jgi:hypothetical protein
MMGVGWVTHGAPMDSHNPIMPQLYFIVKWNICSLRINASLSCY